LHVNRIHDRRETKNEISELKSVIEQLKQKFATTTLEGNSKEAVNVAATQATQITKSKGEIEELRNLLKASDESYTEMMKQSRETEKVMKSLQLQVTGMRQSILEAQPIGPYQPCHDKKFMDQRNSKDILLGRRICYVS
jgi:hypothetical protein